MRVFCSFRSRCDPLGYCVLSGRQTIYALELTMRENVTSGREKKSFKRTNSKHLRIPFRMHSQIPYGRHFIYLDYKDFRILITMCLVTRFVVICFLLFLSTQSFISFALSHSLHEYIEFLPWPFLFSFSSPLSLSPAAYRKQNIEIVFRYNFDDFQLYRSSGIAFHAAVSFKRFEWTAKYVDAVEKPNCPMSAAWETNRSKRVPARWMSKSRRAVFYMLSARINPCRIRTQSDRQTFFECRFGYGLAIREQVLWK